MGEHGMHLLESVWYMQTQLLLPVSLLEMSGGKEFASTARARWGCRVVSLVRRGESSHRTLPSTQQHWSVQKRTSAVPLNPHEGVYDTGGTAAVGLPRQPKSEETSQSEKGLGCDSITYQPSRRLTEITLYSVHCPNLHKTKRKNNKNVCGKHYHYLPIFKAFLSLYTWSDCPLKLCGVAMRCELH